MNYQYPIPGSAGSSVASFVADGTNVLGDVDKSIYDVTSVSVDYSQITPAVTLVHYSFRVSPGGMPPLMVGGPPELSATSNQLTFMLGQGIGGQQYTVQVIVHTSAGNTRTDVLNVNVLGDSNGCQHVLPPIPLNNAVSGDGAIIVNTGPRFFVSATPPISANVLDRWYNTTTNVTYDYVTNGVTSSWQAGSGGGGGGGGGGTGLSDVTPIAQIYPDGVSTTFTLVTATGGVVNILNPSALIVSVDGVWQEAGVSYTLANGNLLTFSTAPHADSVIFMVWFTPTVPDGG